ncbi:MAG: M1 family metallopeptidase [Saprospiraceae bacterium]|nr:M1 family metallopeptidase [Saprospiraceae bacterium]
MLRYFLITLISISGLNLFAQSNHGNKFEQLGPQLRSPNQYRGADGAPGPEYWQQRADYVIDAKLDVKNHRLEGSEKITYFNESPSVLRYLWLQLDENEHSPTSEKHRMEPSSIKDAMSEKDLEGLEPWRNLEKYGHKIRRVVDEKGRPLEYTINGTSMRIELPSPLKSGDEFTFHIDWYYNLIDRINNPSSGRGGYEFFEKDGNYLYTIVQWFPRLCVYNDFMGWQNKQFVGRGEFALTFGNYDVKMTLPSDFVVGATGECQNYDEMLTSGQLTKWNQAQKANKPLEIVTLDDAKRNEKKDISKTMSTWHYKAENVRDFAWTASKKFIWDAMPHITEEGKKVMCMSYYPKEAYPIYNKFSTKTVAHTLETYSKYTIPYPYPVAISVEAANGMEYPMICFNPGRAEDDGTYTERAKIAALTVIIHEVGHNYFPMIINSDERQWAWFDEGLNSFLQFIAEQEFDSNYPHWFVPYQIAGYMSSPKDQLEPIMTNSENIINYGSNAYDKPAAALNILRETIMGRELFDYAFKEYSRRWAFKHPTPDDFFRTMEDASAVDLDWFWKGWFYSIDAVDISLDSVAWFKVEMDENPEKTKREWPVTAQEPFNHISKMRNEAEGVEFAVKKDPSLNDYYSTYKPWETKDSTTYVTYTFHDETYSKKEKKKLFSDKNYYELHFSNQGGLVMPVIIQWMFEDGTYEIERIPVNIWRKNENSFTKVFVKNKVVTGVIIDPFKETADINESNNVWPEIEFPSRFEVFKKHKIDEGKNPMQKAKKRLKKKVNKP